MRQKLGMAAGYGVADIVVREGSDLVGQSIGDSSLRDRDVSVLMVQKNGHVHPNPRRDYILEVNDRLTCFGHLDSMRALAPNAEKRRVQIDELPGEPLPQLERNSRKGAKKRANSNPLRLRAFA